MLCRSPKHNECGTGKGTMLSHTHLQQSWNWGQTTGTFCVHALMTMHHWRHLFKTRIPHLISVLPWQSNNKQHNKKYNTTSHILQKRHKCRHNRNHNRGPWIVFLFQRQCMPWNEPFCKFDRNHLTERETIQIDKSEEQPHTYCATYSHASGSLQSVHHQNKNDNEN